MQVSQKAMGRKVSDISHTSKASNCVSVPGDHVRRKAWSADVSNVADTEHQLRAFKQLCHGNEAATESLALVGTQ